MTRTAWRTALLIPCLVLPALAMAHDGHGAGSGPHWHATDVWGFVATGVVLAIAIWFYRRK